MPSRPFRFPREVDPAILADIVELPPSKSMRGHRRVGITAGEPIDLAQCAGNFTENFHLISTLPPAHAQGLPTKNPIFIGTNPFFRPVAQNLQQGVLKFAR
jgi:hypothetical protein